MGVTMTPAVVDIITEATNDTLILIAVMLFLILLVQKEIADGLESPRARQLGQALKVGVVPLFFVFVSAAILKVLDVL